MTEFLSWALLVLSALLALLSSGAAVDFALEGKGRKTRRAFFFRLSAYLFPRVGLFYFLLSWNIWQEWVFIATIVYVSLNALFVTIAPICCTIFFLGHGKANRFKIIVFLVTLTSFAFIAHMALTASHGPGLLFVDPVFRYQ